MIAQAILGLLNSNENLTKQQNALNNNFDQSVANVRNRMQLLQQQRPTAQGGHIDMQSIIDGVFTGNKNRSNGNLPNGFLGGGNGIV